MMTTIFCRHHASAEKAPKECSAEGGIVRVVLRPESVLVSTAFPARSPHEVQARREDTEMLTAVFEEWPLQDAVLKRVTEDGLTTFQLQFTWALPTARRPEGNAARGLSDIPTSKAVDDTTTITATAYTEFGL
jgi:hypothetical protein